MIDYSNLYKPITQFAGDYWNIQRALTYKRPVVVVTGARGVGKSTQIAGLALLDYKKNGKQFIYFRRYKEQTRITAQSFFDGVPEMLEQSTGFHIDAFKYEKSAFWIGTDTGEQNKEGKTVYKWECCGYALSLSKEEDYKSKRFPNVRTLIGDEFISKDDTKYLGTRDNPGKEWEAIISLYSTVDRDRDQTTLFLLGNKATIYNPVCMSLGIDKYVTAGARFTAPKNALWVWCNVKSSDVKATENYKQSFAYRLADPKTRLYAYENSGFDEDDSFIARPKTSICLGNVRIHGEEYGILAGIGVDTEKIYVATPCDGYATISLDDESHKDTDIDTVMKWRESGLLTRMREMYKMGRLYFKDIRTKKVFLQFLQFMA